MLHCASFTQCQYCQIVVLGAGLQCSRVSGGHWQCETAFSHSIEAFNSSHMRKDRLCPVYELSKRPIHTECEAEGRHTDDARNSLLLGTFHIQTNASAGKDKVEAERRTEHLGKRERRVLCEFVHNILVSERARKAVN